MVIPDTSSRPGPVLGGNAHPLYYRSEDFPVLPTNKEPAAKRGAPTEQNKSVWFNHEATVTQTPGNTNAYNAVPPPAFYDSPPVYAFKSFVQKPVFNSKIQTMQVPVNPAEDGLHCMTSSGRVVDPDHPDYNPVVFHNALLERYVCPYKICR